jgi:Flp pilus assembly protein TadG
MDAMRPLSFFRPLSRGPSARPSRGLRRSGRLRRRGATVVEFAIVAPLLFLLIFAALEFGRVVMVQQIITNASREGARRGILEQTTVSQVETTVSDYLADCSIAGATVAVSPGDLGKAGFSDPVSVTVSVPYKQISWLPSPQFLDGVDLSVESVMGAERPE